MKRIFVIGLVILAFLAAASFTKSRKASTLLTAALQEQAALSNQLAQAAAQVAEKDAAIQTLRVQQNLSASDINMLSNRLETVQETLRSEQARAAAGEQGIRGLEAQLQVAKTELLSAAQQRRELEQRLQAANQQVQETEGNLNRAREQAAELLSRLNSSEAARAELLKKWNDPAALRAKSKEINRTLPTTMAEVGSFTRRTQLVLQSDGSVREVP